MNNQTLFTNKGDFYEFYLKEMFSSPASSVRMNIIKELVDQANLHFPEKEVKAYGGCSHSKMRVTSWGIWKCACGWWKP